MPTPRRRKNPLSPPRVMPIQAKLEEFFTIRPPIRRAAKIIEDCLEGQERIKVVTPKKKGQGPTWDQIFSGVPTETEADALGETEKVAEMILMRMERGEQKNITPPVPLTEELIRHPYLPRLLFRPKAPSKRGCPKLGSRRRKRRDGKKGERKRSGELPPGFAPERAARQGTTRHPGADYQGQSCCNGS